MRLRSRLAFGILVSMLSAGAAGAQTLPYDHMHLAAADRAEALSVFHYSDTLLARTR